MFSPSLSWKQIAIALFPELDNNADSSLDFAGPWIVRAFEGLPMRMLVLLLVAVSAETIAICPCFGQAKSDPYVDLLRKHEIEPTTESLSAYFRSLGPDAESSQRAASLIRQLGDANFFRRESAMAELIRRPTIHPGLLDAAMAGNDPEIRWRAKQISKQLGNRGARLLYAALTVIRRNRVEGLTPAVLENVPLTGEAYLRVAAGRALAATVQSTDADYLRKRSRTGDVFVRMVAISAYSTLPGNAVQADVLALLKDTDDRIQAAAAESLADRGHRASLPVLAVLLDSPRLEVRVVAARVLRDLSGKTFGYTAYESSAKRSVARTRWRRWITADAPLATLKFPLQAVRHERGLTLACAYASNRLYELDGAGNVVWEISPGRYPWGCQGLPNGHRLVATHSSREVVEYDAEGKVVWRKSALPGGPSSVSRLENGNTLIACTDSHHIVELDQNGKTVWDVRVSGRPTDARRLEDGRTLVALQSGRRVVEVDPTGRVAWEITGVQSPLSAERLSNGNTLVASSGNGGRVAEYDRSGKIIWSNSSFKSPWCAQRLANGNTLVTDQAGITEVTAEGRRVWFKALPGVGKIHRY